jgi:glycosyltransferase involved in cell wall biosynthesis
MASINKKSPISMCLIVKNEPLLEQSLLSIRDYVEELVIVDTGSTDGTAEIAKKYADIFEVYTDCNNPQTGLIESFSKARQRSFDLATQPWVMWMDGDDVIEGAENLVKFTANFDPVTAGVDGVSFLFPYEYSYDEKGECNLRHYRERLLSNKNLFKWFSPVHEVLVNKDNFKIQLICDDSIVYKHKRQFSNKIMESGRNLRILKKFIENNGKDDARQYYYIGLEYLNNGLVQEGIDHLVKYNGMSGWDDERVMACLKLAEVYQNLGQYEEALKWAFKCVEINEFWSEGYFAVGKMFYFLAMKDEATAARNWQRCIHFIKTGLSFPPTKTLLFINPLERDHEIHKFLNIAYNKIGDVKSALESCNTALSRKYDESLNVNKKLYEEFLAKQSFFNSLGKLKEIGSLSDSTINSIVGLLSNQNILPAQTTVAPPLSQYIAPPTDPNNPFPIAAVSANSTSWQIPDTFDTQGYPIKMTDAQLQAVVLMVWKEFMNHDELLSATKFLENAPYRVRYTDATLRALSQTKATYSWITDPDLVQKHNSPLDDNGNVITVELGVPLPGKMVAQQGGRFDMVVEKLEPKSKIVDFGCFDGAFTNRYGLLGHEVVGLDLTETSVDLANRKAKEFNTGAKHIVTHFEDALNHVPQNYFDVATSTDTYEHLLDPVKEMLIPATKMLKPNGRFLMSTPHGSWFRGLYVPWAHPWLWGDWLGPHKRGHLIAPGSWDVVLDFRKAGFTVKNCHAKISDTPDVPGQGNVFCEAQMEPRVTTGDIIFYIGNSVEPWNPESIKKTGIGGSEIAACEMAKKLAALGNRVRIYGDCRETEGIYDFVEYYHYDKFHDLSCDTLIISRQAQMLGDQFNVTSKLKLLWVHDMFALNATPNLLLKADKILALSSWHKDNLISTHNIHPDQVIVTRNGINLERFNKSVNRNKFKCVNSSSPDRSWPILLDLWKDIKKRVPQAELHLFYGFKNWEHAAQFQPGHAELIATIKNKIEELKQFGVVYHDRVSQENLAEEFLSAGAWIYPTWFNETSCISAMEAQAAGLRIVTSNIAALQETVANRGVLLNGSWTTPEYKADFINNVVSALIAEGDSDRKQLQDYAKQNFSWDSLAQEWNQMFKELIQKNLVNPGNPYQPSRKYL